MNSFKEISLDFYFSHCLIYLRETSAYKLEILKYGNFLTPVKNGLN